MDGRTKTKCHPLCTACTENGLLPEEDVGKGFDRLSVYCSFLLSYGKPFAHFLWEVSASGKDLLSCEDGKKVQPFSMDSHFYFQILVTVKSEATVNADVHFFSQDRVVHSYPMLTELLNPHLLEHSCSVAHYTEFLATRLGFTEMISPSSSTARSCRTLRCCAWRGRFWMSETASPSRSGNS